MKYTTVGNTDLRIPAIMFGTSCLGNLYQSLSQETKRAIVREMFQHVETPVIDSAGKYGAGLALEVLGECLQELGIRNEDVVISNKLGWARVPLTTPEPTFEPGVWVGVGVAVSVGVGVDVGVSVGVDVIVGVQVGPAGTTL